MTRSVPWKIGLESSRNQVEDYTKDRVGSLEVGASKLTRLEPWKSKSVLSTIQVGVWNIDRKSVV